MCSRNKFNSSKGPGSKAIIITYKRNRCSVKSLKENHWHWKGPWLFLEAHIRSLLSCFFFVQQDIKCWFRRNWDKQFTALLTHWGRVMHICVSKLTIIGSNNGLSPDRRQAIIWTNAGLLLMGPLGTNFCEILIENLTFSFKKMCLKVSSANWRPFVSASMCRHLGAGFIFPYILFIAVMVVIFSDRPLVICNSNRRRQLCQRLLSICCSKYCFLG